MNFNIKSEPRSKFCLSKFLIIQPATFIAISIKTSTICLLEDLRLHQTRMPTQLFRFVFCRLYFIILLYVSAHLVVYEKFQPFCHMFSVYVGFDLFQPIYVFSFLFPQALFFSLGPVCILSFYLFPVLFLSISSFISHKLLFHFILNSAYFFLFGCAL